MTETGQMTQTGQRDITDHLVLWLAINPGELCGRIATAQGVAEHWSVVGVQLCCVIVLFILLSLFYFPFLVCHTELSTSQHTTFTQSTGRD